MDSRQYCTQFFVYFLFSEWLTPALAAMELSQMVVQAMWDTDSVFKQLPHFTDEIINRLKSEAPEVETIFDFIEMDDEKRKRVLKGLSNKHIQEIAKVCARYPNIEVTYRVLSTILSLPLSQSLSP